MLFKIFKETFGKIPTAFEAEKVKNELFPKMTNNPTDTEVDAFIAFINKYGTDDRPNSWHQIRGIWYACNHSPRITTQKKEQLKTFLLVKGLYLQKDEAVVIDNYGK